MPLQRFLCHLGHGRGDALLDFFGAAPELDGYLADLTARAEQGVRVIVLRLKRTRNPDMVCLERLQHFLEEMQKRGVPVLLCGVREDFADALARLGFHHWLPAERIFLEDRRPGNGAEQAGPDSLFGLAARALVAEGGREPELSSTVKAVKRAYELLSGDLCSTCPRRHEVEMERAWYYMI